MEKVNLNALPKHISIIMDGNRRWAKEQGKSTKLGHKAGAEALERIVRHANNMKIGYITVYAFSTENWNRTKEEVGVLMMLLENYLEDYGSRADTENIRVKFIGDLEKLPKSTQKSIKKIIEKTKNNTGIVFSIAFNYGGRLEIVNALKRISEKISSKEIDLNDINEELISDNLYTKGVPDPDLMIRTSGEIRTSNFMPWQSIYSELYFAEKYWPDFSEDDLDKAIIVYQKRTRTFGAS